MKKTIFLLSFLFVLSLFMADAQQNRNQTFIISNGQESDIFYHTIERGQTVYAIATMYGVSVEDIYRLNPDSRKVIKAGDVLKVPQRDAAVQPAPATTGEYIYHAIRSGETLYALSIRYSVSAEVIMKANPGLSVSTFHTGKIIRIPEVVQAAQPKEQVETKTQTVTKVVEYTVARRETMYNITRKFGVSSTELMKLNPQLRDGLKAGMVIQVPVKEQETVTVAVEQPQERDVNALLNEQKQIVHVDHIQVALLLPFMSNEINQSAESKRFVEYYEGLLLAVDNLKKSGVPVVLSVYDTGTGTKQIKEILKEDALKKAHLIIGALQNEQIKLIADFAQEHNIKYVVPFTRHNDDVLSNANIFQVNTPHSYLYSIAAAAGCDLFAKDNIIIVNIGDKDDKPEFIQAMKTEMESRGIKHRELSYQAETFTVDIGVVLDSTRRNVVLPSSSSLEALNNIKSPLRMYSVLKDEEREPYMISLFGYPEWQTYMRESIEDFYALNTYIYTYFYADNLSKEVQDFYTLYKNWYSKNLINTFPKYGILGYDTGMYFLSAIRQYGTNFENNLDKIRYKSIQTGFSFERVNNWGGFINTNTFIVQYKNDNTVTRMTIK